jgi:alpha-mannosidase
MPFESFRKRLVSLIDHLLEVLETDPAFSYFELDGQVIVLSDYLEIKPENEQRVRKLIEKERIIIGPWYVLPDEFLVTGESIIRNLQLGIRLAREFGKPSMIGYLPDQFGHIAQMPQVLAGFGMRSAIVWRGVGESVNRTQFLWESPDGTRLFTVYLADSYGNGAYLPLKPTLLKERLTDLIKRQEPYCDIDSMLIMNGLDHLEPQDGLPAQLGKAVPKLRGMTFEMGNLAVFIRQARKQAKDLTVHTGEFRSSRRVPLIPGVTSARVRQKRRDFTNCRLLEKYVEPLCAWAALCGDDRPHRNFIDYAWRLTLQNHPHDSICGCSVDEVHEEMETRFDKVEQVAVTLRDDALSFLASQLDSSWMEANATGLCIYNPTSAPAQIVDVVTDIEEPDFVNSLKNRDGTFMPFQKTVGERELFFGAQMSPAEVAEYVAGMEERELLGFYINNMLWQRDGTVLNLTLIMGHAPVGDVDLKARRKSLLEALNDPSVELVDVKGISGAKTRISFIARNLSPVGLTVYSLSDEFAGNEGTLSVSSSSLENNFYHILVNVDGTLNIRDKESGAEFRGCLRFVDEGDRGDSYNFDEVPDGEVVDAPGGPLEISVVEDGPVRATLRIGIILQIPDRLETSRDKRSSQHVDTPITTLVSLYRNFKRIDFTTTFDNQSEDHRLRVLFNAPFRTSETVVESTFGTVTRSAEIPSADDHHEKPIGTSPQKTFSCLENGSAGMALFNRGIPEIEARAGENTTMLALTLVRAVGWLAREDLNARPDAAGPTLEAPGAQCRGPHTFEYAFTSYQDGFEAAGIVGQAHAYAFPPIAQITARQRGRIKDGASLVQADNPNISVSAVEPSSREGRYTVRLYNTTGSDQNTRLSLWGRKIRVHEVNLLGKKLSRDPLRRKAGRFELFFRPAEIRTLQVVIQK